MLRQPTLAILLSCAVACVPPEAASAAGAAGAAAGPAEDGQWTMPAKNYAATRYSGLTQINAQNARSLRPVWTFSTGVLAGHEGQPLVVGETMYVVTPWPNVLYAFDLRKEGYPLRWKYRPDVSSNALGVACCDAVNRGAFYLDGRIVYNLLDGHTVAVDARSGRELWKTAIADMGNGETVTMAPVVVRDRVLVGASGGEFGIYGWLKGLDFKTGQVVWTGHNMGPDADMLARPDTFKPPYEGGIDVGAKSWAGESWKTGGAPVWGWISYDPELDLIYYGTGNAAPYDPEARPGDNKWSASVLARRPGTGELVWAYQFTPHDNWDYDATGAMVLVDLTIAGRPVKALVHFDKNGFAYTLDRATGKLLVAAPFASVNWAKSVDLVSGRPLIEPARQTGVSPRTHLVYTATNSLGMDSGAAHAQHLRATPYIGVDFAYHPGPGGNLGAFIAWDATTGRKAWEDKESYPSWSGALVTAGDVVFYGTLDGWFKAVDAHSGQLLSKFKVGSGVVGNPIAYRGPDGKEYVAIYAGIGGDWALLAGDTRSDDPTDVREPAEFMKDIARHTSQGGIVWIFGL